MPPGFLRDCKQSSRKFVFSSIPDVGGGEVEQEAGSPPQGAHNRHIAAGELVHFDNQTIGTWNTLEY